jgi:hypothetical protein
MELARTLALAVETTELAPLLIVTTGSKKQADLAVYQQVLKLAGTSVNAWPLLA